MGQVIVSGLQIGSSYALMALAIVLILKATDVPNFAMAEMGLIPAFLIWLGISHFHWSFLTSVTMGVAVGAVIGITVERLFIRPILGQSHFSMIFVTIGLLFTLNGLTGLFFGSQVHSVDSPFSGTLVIGTTVVSIQSIMAISVGLAIMLVLLVFFHTRLGVQMRAVAEDRTAPRLLGVRLPRIFRLAWGMAGAIATIAVLLAAQGSILNDQTGQVLIVTGFVAAALGGFQSITGAFVGGLGLGVAEELAGNYISTSSASVVSLLVVVLVLMVRPQGVFGETGAREV